MSFGAILITGHHTSELFDTLQLCGSFQRSRSLFMLIKQNTSAAASHRNLFESPIWDRRKGIACPSKYLILAVDTPDGTV